MTSRLLSIVFHIMVMAIILSVVLLFPGLAVLVLLHICIVGRAFRRGLSTIGRGDRCVEREKGLSHEDLEKLPCFEFKIISSGGEKGAIIDSCAVCLESFQVGERCRLLPACRHSFHAHCVDSWLKKSPICPICRTHACHGHHKGGLVSDVQQQSTVGFELQESRAVSVGAGPCPLHASASE